MDSLLSCCIGFKTYYEFLCVTVFFSLYPRISHV